MGSSSILSDVYICQGAEDTPVGLGTQSLIYEFHVNIILCHFTCSRWWCFCAPAEHCCDHSRDTGRKKLDPCSVTGHIMCIHILDISSYIRYIGEIWRLSESSPFDEQN